MSWAVRAVQLPDGDRPVDLWVDAAGCLVTEPVLGAERLPGRYVAPGLVDAHAHPAVGRGRGGARGSGWIRGAERAGGVGRHRRVHSARYRVGGRVDVAAGPGSRAAAGTGGGAVPCPGRAVLPGDAARSSAAG